MCLLVYGGGQAAVLVNWALVVQSGAQVLTYAHQASMGVRPLAAVKLFSGHPGFPSFGNNIPEGFSTMPVDIP